RFLSSLAPHCRRYPGEAVLSISLGGTGVSAVTFALSERRRAARSRSQAAAEQIDCSEQHHDRQDGYQLRGSLFCSIHHDFASRFRFTPDADLQEALRSSLKLGLSSLSKLPKLPELPKLFNTRNG